MTTIIRCENVSSNDVRYYSGCHYDEEWAKCEFIDETGYPANKVLTLSFDQVDQDDMSDFIEGKS